ncbi:MAG: AbrB/MazE/SpoVT family DNA-binding domain-containing protein [Trueperaceae bacterium]
MSRGVPAKTDVPLVQLSGRGQVTVPSSVRRQLGLRAGDAFRIRVDDGRLILDPVAVLEVELYDEARIAEFERASAMTDAELRSAEEAWRRQP